MTIVEFIGDKMRQRRIEKNIKQDILASLVGISRAQMLNIEKGRSSTTPDKLHLICSIINLPISELFPPLDVIEFEIITTEVEVTKIKKVRTPIIKTVPANRDK